jgi:Flp pilus assembly protein TadB
MSPHLAQLPAARVCVLAAVGALACAGLFTLAVIGVGPGVVLPFLMAASLAGAVIAAYELPVAIVELRRSRIAMRFRRELERLPETEHPLGL